MTTLNKITYDDKNNPIPVVTRSEQATAEDFNEIKEVVNNLIDEVNEVGLMPEAPADGNPYVRQDKDWVLLPGLKQMVYTITLSASSDVATRITGGYTIKCGDNTVTGWTLAADAGVNLLITHTLIGRKIAFVNVWEAVSGGEQTAKPFSDAYAQLVSSGQTVKIVGLDNLAVALRIELIFN